MTQTDISPSIIARVTQAARYVISGVAPDTWFGPMQPLQPMAPADVAGRRFDYPTGYNLTYTPRSYEGVTFADLRALADNCDILRSVIETRKDQMEAMDWAVRVAQPLNGRISVSATDDQKRRIDQVTAFLHCPDKEHSFAQWLRQLLEDMFVADAACLYKRRTVTGELYALEVMDGATIKILLDEGGRLPAAPDPAYQQVLKGVPAADYTRDELMYLMHNPRSHKVYGYSHVEQVLVTVNILIRRAMHQLDYYREGSQPDAFVGLPKEWNQEQIVAFQKHFDAMLSGNLGLRRRLRFMPGEFKYQETKPPPLKDMYDDYLARIICFVFSISAEPFISHVNRATAESSQSRAIDEGLAPLMRYVSGIMNRIIACEFASPDLEFVWQDNRVQDPKEAAQIDVAYVQAGIMTVNEVRANMGLMPLSAGQLPTPVAQKKTSGGLFKDDSGDDDEEDDDDDEGEEGSDSDSSDDGSSDFDSKHPRWPAGSPGGIGGEFAPKDEGSISTDEVRSALENGLDQPSQLSERTQVAADDGGMSDALTDSAPIPQSIATIHDIEIQDTSPEALDALNSAKNGATLYRVGQFNESMAGESQYWSLENPFTTADYANNMGIPNIKADFVLQGTLNSNAVAITNVAPGLGNNAGGGIQVITSPNGVNVTSMTAVEGGAVSSPRTSSNAPELSSTGEVGTGAISGGPMKEDTLFSPNRGIPARLPENEE